MDQKTYKIDLHTHSIVSYDGGVTEADYTAVLHSGKLDAIAITDHNETSFAQKLQAHLGPQIIIGEEIMTLEGEIIGLFLHDRIKPYQNAAETIQAIHAQGGLVYIPHPFETVRNGIQKDILVSIAKDIDIIEGFNARSLQPVTRIEAGIFAKDHHLPLAASSDAHGRSGIGTSYTKISELPTSKTLVELLYEGKRHELPAPFWTFLHPKLNRFKKFASKKWEGTE